MRSELGGWGERWEVSWEGGERWEVRWEGRVSGRE